METNKTLKEFKVEVIQKLEGNYRGEFVMLAENKKELLLQLANLTEEQIEEIVDNWETENFIGIGKYNFENIQEI